MASSMSPFEIVKSIVPTLSEKEKQEIRVLLGTGVVPPCAKLGHKAKVLGLVPAGWFTSAYWRMVCERCGITWTVEK